MTATAQVPVLITRKMRQDLEAAGYTPAEIDAMTPEDAWAALGGMPSPAASPGPANPGNGKVDDLAREAFRAALDGKPPSIDPADCGPWAPVVADLQAAPDADAAQRAFAAMATKAPDLIRLLAGDKPPRKTSWSMAELYAATFPAPRWAVPGLLPVGLTFLAGRPKLGKSWLALQIAQAVGTGGLALGERVAPGKVLYLALEDSPRRLQERCKKQGAPASAAVRFETEWDALDKGGLTTLQTEIGRGGYTLVIVDTLARSLARSDQMDMGDMTMILGNLQRLAQTGNLAILLLDHHRKSNGFISNPVDDILGSTAKAAVTDAALGLFREQGKRGAVLKITGREIEEKDLALEFDGLTCTWQALGEAGEVLKNTVRAEVLAAVGQLEGMGEVPTTTTIAQTTGKGKDQVSRALADLLQVGQVVKGKREGRNQPYHLPPSDPFDAVMS